MDFILQLFFVSALFGAVCSYLAHKKQKNLYLWFAIGFCFGIFGFIFLFFLTLSQSKQKILITKQMDLQKKEDPLSLLSLYADNLWYYVNENNEAIGPISHNLLKERFQKGKISLSSLVWNEKLSSWKKMQDLLAIGQKEPSTNLP